jgi:hypothetical protein
MTWLWTTNPNFPETSSYPIIDFAVKTHLSCPSQSTADSQAGYDPADDLATAAGDRSIRKLLKGRRTMIYKISKTEIPAANTLKRAAKDPVASLADVTTASE